jgi:hypothetical protein
VLKLFKTAQCAVGSQPPTIITHMLSMGGPGRPGPIFPSPLHRQSPLSWVFTLRSSGSVSASLDSKCCIDTPLPPVRHAMSTEYSGYLTGRGVSISQQPPSAVPHFDRSAGQQTATPQSVQNPSTHSRLTCACLSSLTSDFFRLLVCGARACVWSEAPPLR